MSDEIRAVVDTDKVNRLLEDLKMSKPEARKAIRSALVSSARIIQRQARTNLIGVNNSDGSTLKSENLKKWVRYSVYRKNDGVRVHIQQTWTKKWNQSFLLRFFEEGTRMRWNKKVKKGRLKGHALKKQRYTGKIIASKFFSRAVDAKKQAAQDKLEYYLIRHIERIAKKKQ